MSGGLGVRLVGDGLDVPSVDGIERSYLSLDAATSTGALPAVASRVQELLPWYSSVRRGAGWKSQLATARLSAEHAIAVRHGCFCAHPYLLHLLGLTSPEVADYHAAVLRGDRRRLPGAVRASAGIATTIEDIDRFLDALARIVGGEPPPVPYDQDEHTGDFWPNTDDPPWSSAGRRLGASCTRG